MNKNNIVINQLNNKELLKMQSYKYYLIKIMKLIKNL